MEKEIRVNRSKKARIIKIIAAILFVVISTIVCVYLFSIMKDLGTQQGITEFKEKIEQTGEIGALLLIGLQFSQMFLPIVPGEPIEVLAGMCYGAVGGMIFMLITFFAFSIFIFFLVKKIGINLVYTFCNEQQVDKIQKSKVFQNPKKVEKVLYVLYLIPGTPKDLFTYVAGLLPIEKPLRFLTLSTLARIPSIISSTIAGAGIVNGSFVISLIIYAAIYISVILGVIIYKKITKDKDSDEAFKDLNEKTVKNNDKTEKLLEEVEERQAI